MKKISLILIALIFIFNCNLFSQNAEKVISINKKSLVSIFSAEKVYVTYKDYISYNFVYDTTVLYGSGFFIDKQGYIATCLHVVDNIDSILVKTYDSIYYYAEIISADIKNDLAIIKIKNANQIFHPVTLGNSDNIKIGEECFTIGNPLGYENTISKGIVAGIRTNQKIEFGLNEIKVFDKVIQTDAAISPGNSGGAMFNSKGEVIGITAYCESSLFFGTFGNLIFAVAINTLKELSKNMGSHEHLINDSLNIILKNNYLDKYLAKASKYKSEIVHNLKLLDARDTSVTNDTLKSKLDSLNNIYINKANELYDICFRIKPDTFIVYFELVDLYIKIEDYTKANMIFDTLYIKFQNDSTMTNNLYFYYLECCYKIKSDLESYWDYTKQNDTLKKPNNFISRQDSINRINFSKVENLYNKCIILKPDSLIAYNDLLDIYLYTENIKKAESLYDLFKERIKSKEKLKSYTLALAKSYLYSKDTVKAIQFFNKILKIEPDNITIKYYLAITYENFNNIKLAKQILDEIIKKDTSYYWAYIEIGKIYYKTENYKQAKRFLMTGLDKFTNQKSKYYDEYEISNNYNAYYYLGLISVKENNKNNAILYFSLLNNSRYPKENLLKLFKEIRNM